jgi:hypothetical protein
MENGERLKKLSEEIQDVDTIIFSYQEMKQSFKGELIF